MLFILVIVAVLVVWAINYYLGKTKKAWRQTARTLDLSYAEPGLFGQHRMRGEVNNRSVRVRTETEGGTRSRRTYTIVNVDIKDSPFSPGMKMTKKGFLESVGEFFGAQDVKSGDTSFDETVRVTGVKPSDLKEMLTPRKQVAIKSHFQKLNDAKITASSVESRRKGTIRNKGVLVSFIKRTIRLARLLDEAEEDDQKKEEHFEDGLNARNSGDLEKARSAFEEVQEEDASEVEAREQIASTYALEDEHEKSAEEYRKILEEHPDDPSARNEYIRAAAEAGYSKDDIQKQLEEIDPGGDTRPEPEPEPVAQEEADDQPAPEPVSEGNPSQEEVISRVFEPLISTYEARKRFQKHFQGRDVEWSGRVRNVEEISFDRVFRGQTGVKVKVILSPANRESHQEKEISALIRFDEEKLPEEVQPGQDVGFSGTLFKVDRFMGNIYLKNGSLR